jgi:hypothetical protein
VHGQSHGGCIYGDFVVVVVGGGGGGVCICTPKPQPTFALATKRDTIMSSTSHALLRA